MERERILITVKTYPTLSRKYGETVCTAGLRADGTWVRMYPVPFRRLEEKEQYRKYDWVECRLQRNRADVRPETYRPVDPHELVPVGHIGTDDVWRERREIVLDKARVHEDLDELIRLARANTISLAVFKPARILDLVVEADEREWKPERVSEMRAASRQRELFADDVWRETFKIIRKMPFKFSYRFEDAAGKRSEQQILDWEIGQLYWNCLRAANGDEDRAVAKVREKYLDQFPKKDLHLFLGTTQQWHQVAPNPWVIIGMFPAPRKTQLDLFG